MNAGRLTMRWSGATLVLLAGLCWPWYIGRATAAADGAPRDGAAAGVLVSAAVARAPVVDGTLDALWDDAAVVTIPVVGALDGATYGSEVTLRSVYTAERVYFYAEWPGAPAEAVAGVARNRLTIHYDLPEPWPGAAQTSCLVACHTGFMDDDGGDATVRPETVPAGQTAALPAAGGWRDGRWRLEWSRPLREPNLFDVQFDDLARPYPFFVKVFAHRADLPDAVSAEYALQFAE